MVSPSSMFLVRFHIDLLTAQYTGPSNSETKTVATFDFLSPLFFFRGCVVEYFDFCYLDLGNSFVLAVIAVPI